MKAAMHSDISVSQVFWIAARHSLVLISLLFPRCIRKRSGYLDLARETLCYFSFNGVTFYLNLPRSTGAFQ